MKSLAIFNNKGGVGKTTAAINLAYALQNPNRRVLVVDCDGQCNLSNFFYGYYDCNLYSVLSGEMQPEFVATRYENIDILVSSPEIDELKGVDDSKAEALLGIAAEHGYELIIFDLPPAMTEITRCFLSVADATVVPLDVSKFSVEGLQRVTDRIKAAGANFCGCFLSKYDKSNSTDAALLDVLNANLRGDMLKNGIPYSKTVKNSISYGQTAQEYRAWTAGAKSYGRLAAEILERI